MYSQPEDLSCKVFKEILKGIRAQKEKLTIAESLKGKIYITADSLGMNPKIVNISDMPNKVIDSLVEISNYVSISNDSLFSDRSENLIIDTFCFFTKACDIVDNGRMFLFTNKSESNKYQPNINIIEVKSININNNHLVVELKCRKSKSVVDFYFQWNTSSPILSKIKVYHIE